MGIIKKSAKTSGIKKPTAIKKSTTVKKAGTKAVGKGAKLPKSLKKAGAVAKTIIGDIPIAGTVLRAGEQIFQKDDGSTAILNTKTGKARNLRRSRHINPMNYKAFNKSLRRVRVAKNLAKRIDKALGKVAPRHHRVFARPTYTPFRRRRA